MKITRFTIKALHGFFDYDVNLNEDITFLFGENGSGKTTVLSMLDHVISGELYKLFDYEFKNITVFFKENDMTHSEAQDKNRVEVRLKKSRWQQVKQLIVKFKEKDGTIKYDRDYAREIDFFESSFDIRQRFFDSFMLAEEIKDCFNYLFLPLNRLNYKIKDLDNMDFRMIRNKAMHNPNYVFNNSESMHSVEQLVGESVSQINSSINKLNTKMRQDILKSALEMSRDDVDLNEFFKYFAKDDLISELEDTKKRYIKLLEDLKTITTLDQKEEYDKYFNDLINQVQKSVNASEKNGVRRQLPAQLIGTYVELIRIKKLIKIYENIEDNILELKTPINDFLKYTNIFLKDGKDEKEIIVNSLGEVFFITNYTKEPVRLKYLSSGEKHIVTLISNLIFKVDRSKFTIFIIDEPELSLHLSWQKKIVETIHEINKNMQLVFATHSPEIIGKYSSKAFELEKHYKPVEKLVEKIDGMEGLDDLDNFLNELESNL